MRPSRFCISTIIISARRTRIGTGPPSTGSAAVSRNRFKDEEFLQFRIPLPPLEQQKAIVDYWNTAQAAVAAAVALAILLGGAALWRATPAYAAGRVVAEVAQTHLKAHAADVQGDCFDRVGGALLQSTRAPVRLIH